MGKTEPLRTLVGVAAVITATSGVMAAQSASAASSAQTPLTGTIRNADALCERLDEQYSMIDSAAGLGAAVLRMKATNALSAITGQRAGSDDSAGLRRVSRESIWLPVTGEEVFGNQQHKARVDAGFVLDRKQNRNTVRLYERADQLFGRLTPLLPASVPYKMQLHILNENAVEAEALPGGHVYISRGALEQNDGVVLLLLAHELAHITKRHQTKALQARLVDTGLTLQGMQQIMSNPVAMPQLVTGNVQKMRGVFAQYDQQQELESDACAMRLMSQLPNVKPLDAVHRFLSVQKDTGQENKTRDDIVYASHPQYPERERRYKEAYAHHTQMAAVGATSSEGASRPTTSSSLTDSATSDEAAASGSSPPPESAGAKARGMFNRLGQGIKGLLNNPSPAEPPAQGGQ